ncbi:hypothetical protein Tco_0723735, partial [Tanacetum coccineum]
MDLGRVVPLLNVNDQGDADVQGVGDDDVNEESGDAAVANHVEENDHAKRKAIGRASGFGLPPIKLRANHGTSSAGESTGGKSIAALQGLLEHSTLPEEVGVAAVATLPSITSFVSLTLEREGGGHTDSVTGPNLRTQRPTKRFVVLSDSSHHSSTNVADDEVTSIVRSSMPPPPVLTTAVATTIIADATSAPVPRAGIKPVPRIIFRDSISTSEANQDVAGPSHPTGTELSADSFFVSQDVDSETLHQTYIPKWNVINDYALDDPDVFRGVIDH